MKSVDFLFETPLYEGLIQSRKSQFTMIVEVEGELLSCHCPTTGRVGNIDISGRPCLLSKSNDLKRKTPYTVEAISLNRLEDKNKSWIGINQNAVNRYVEHFLKNGSFINMIGSEKEVLREQKLGISKIDFLVEDTYLEVKTPLINLQLEIPDYIKLKKATPFSSTDRLVKHITELANSLKTNQRAILLTCFIYDNPGFEVGHRSTKYEQVKNTIHDSISKGVELWQANFKITQESVSLEKYFKSNIQY